MSRDSTEDVQSERDAWLQRLEGYSRQARETAGRGASPTLPPDSAARVRVLQKLEDYARVPGLSDADVAVLMGFRDVVKKGVMTATTAEAFERFLRRDLRCFAALARGRSLARMDAAVKVASGGPRAALETLRAIAPERWNPAQKLEVSGGMEVRSMLSGRSDAELQHIISLAGGTSATGDS